MVPVWQLTCLWLAACLLSTGALRLRAQPSSSQATKAQPSPLRALQANSSILMDGIANALKNGPSDDWQHRHGPIEWHRQDELMTLTPTADKALVVRFYVMPYVMDFIEQALAAGVTYNSFGYQQFVEEPSWSLKYHMQPLGYHAARRACAAEGARLYRGAEHSVELDTRMAVFYPTYNPWYGGEKESVEGENHCDYLIYIEGVARKWDKCSRPHHFICEKRVEGGYHPHPHPHHHHSQPDKNLSPWPAPPCANPPECLDPPPRPSLGDVTQCFSPPCPDRPEVPPVIAYPDEDTVYPDGARSPEQLQKEDSDVQAIGQVATMIQQLLAVVSSPSSTGIRTSMAQRQRPILLMRKILGVTAGKPDDVRARLAAMTPVQLAELRLSLSAHSAVLARWNADRELLNRYVEKVSGKQQLIIPELNQLLATLTPLKAKT